MAHRVPSLRSGVHIVALLVGVAALLTETPVGQTQPKHGTISNLSTVVDGDLVRVSYDLESDDPGVVFTVRLEFSQDGGQTYQAAETVDGDVGLVLRGQRLTITWSAGRDIETVSFGGFEYRVVIESEVVPASVAETASLEVLSQPPGATVSVDGQPRGETPLSLTLAPGEHALAITQDGYLENRQSVDLEAGTAETLSVTLTSTEVTQPVVESGGGRSRLPLILGVVGGGVGAALALAGGGGDVTQEPVFGILNGTWRGTLTESVGDRRTFQQEWVFRHDFGANFFSGTSQLSGSTSRPIRSGRISGSQFTFEEESENLDYCAFGTVSGDALQGELRFCNRGIIGSFSLTKSP